MTNILDALGSSAVNSVNTARVAVNAAPTGTRHHLKTEQVARARTFLLGRGMPADHLENVVFVKGMIGSILIGGDGHEGNIMETVAHNRGADMARTWIAQHP